MNFFYFFGCLLSRFGAETFVNLTFKVLSGSKLDLIDTLRGGGKSRKFTVLFKILGKQQTLKTMQQSYFPGFLFGPGHGTIF